MSISLVIKSWAIVISFIPGRKMRRSTLGKVLEAYLGCPPVISAVPDLLLDVGVDQSVWTSNHRPTLCGVVVPEFREFVFRNSLEDVLRDPRYANVGAEDQEVPYVTRRGAGELDVDRMIVDGCGFVCPLVNGAVTCGQRVSVGHVERECDVVRCKWRAIAPLDTVADVNRDAGVTVVVLVVGSHPWDEFTGEHVEVEETFASRLVKAAA